MQEIKLTLKNTENIGHLSPEQVVSITEILVSLISSGGLTGVKGGQTIIHFDADGNFQGIQLSYWPYRRKRKI